jgi:hypothetical protein
MEGEGNPSGAVSNDLPARVSSHDPGASGRTGPYGENLAEMKKRRKEYVICHFYISCSNSSFSC